MLAWFEPWKSENFNQGRILISHKAIAHDIFREIYPLRTLALDMIKKTELPLWNPYNGAGMPLLATSNMGILDPFNALFFFFPYYLAWGIYINIQLLIIGYFTFIYAKKIKLSTSASLFTAFIYMLSGDVITKSIYLTYGLAIALLPLSLYLLENYFQNPQEKKIYFLPLLFLLIILSTTPQISLYLIIFSSLYILVRNCARNSSPTNRAKKIFLPWILIFLGIGLSSIQLIPTGELSKLANVNSASSTFIFQLHTPLMHYVTIIIPNYFGNPSTYNYWGYGDYIETILYLGSIPCLFAFISFLVPKTYYRNLKVFLATTVFLTILLNISWPLTDFLYRLPIPLISTGVPTRVFLLTTFSLVILSGIGFDYLFDSKNHRKQLLISMAVFSILLILIFVYALSIYLIKLPCPPGPIQSCRLISLRNTVLEVSIFGVGVLLITFFLFFRKKKYVKVIAVSSLIFLTVSAGLYNAYKFLPFSQKEAIMPENRLFGILKNETNGGRIFGIGEANIKTNFATNYRYFDPQYYHPLYLKRYGELVSYGNNGEMIPVLPRSDVNIVDSATTSAELSKRRARLLSLLSIEYLLFKNSEVVPIVDENIAWKDKRWRLLRNDSLPRMYLVNRYEIRKNSQEILKRLFDPQFNPKQSVILEEQLTMSFGEKKLNDLSNIHIKHYGENGLTANINASDKALLVLTDNYYPGWKAYVDNKETKIYRANYTFRAIEIPKGDHQVVFKYQPQSLIIGAAVSFISLIILLLLFIRRLKIGRFY